MVVVVTETADSGAYTPTVVAQIRYMLQWFGEWTEMERSDFLPVLIHGFQRAKSGAVNGLLPIMESLCRADGRPLSLFKCRIKLFTEWVQSWSDDDMESFLSGVRSTDVDFARRYEQKASVAEPERCNGTVNGEHDSRPVDRVQEEEKEEDET